MTISSKGQVTLPLEVRNRLNLRKGDRVRLSIVSEKDKKMSMEARSDMEVIEELYGVFGGPDVEYVPYREVREIAGKKLGEKYRVK